MASDVKGLSDEEFEAFAKKFAVLAKHLNKDVIKASKGKEDKKDTKDIIKAALDNAEIEKETVPNTPPLDEDPKAKLRASFTTEKLIVKK